MDKTGFGCLLTFVVAFSLGCEGPADDPASSAAASGISSGIAGVWIDQDGETWDLNADGTYVDYEADEGTWQLEGSLVTLSYGSECECPHYDLDGTLLSDESIVLYDSDGAEWTLNRSAVQFPTGDSI